MGGVWAGRGRGRGARRVRCFGPRSPFGPRAAPLILPDAGLPGGSMDARGRRGYTGLRWCRVGVGLRFRVPRCEFGVHAGQPVSEYPVPSNGPAASRTSNPERSNVRTEPNPLSLAPISTRATARPRRSDAWPPRVAKAGTRTRNPEPGTGNCAFTRPSRSGALPQSAAARRCASGRGLRSRR